MVIDWDNLKLLCTALDCKQKCSITHCFEPEPKPKKSTKIFTNVRHVSKESTRFYQPKNSTEFHQDKISIDVCQEFKISTDIHQGSGIFADVCQEPEISTKPQQLILSIVLP